MTGFGRGEHNEGDVHATAEVRSVNNRFLDISIRLPRELSQHETDVKELVRSKINRGKINVFVSVQSPQINNGSVHLDIETAKVYKKMLSNLNNELNIEGDIRLEHLLNFPDIFTSEYVEELDSILWKCAQKALTNAIIEMNKLRSQEGKYLAKDLLERLDLIENHLKEIETLSKKNAPEEFKILQQRVSELFNNPEIDKGRLETEIAILAERLDVTEEVVRFRSHNALFRDLIAGKQLAGRSLNFLLQEMNREANTIAAKANNAEISHRVVFVKEEVERLREQVQNVE